MLGQSLVGLKDLPPLLLLFIVCFTAQTLTEFTSNVAIANILLPVLAEMSIATGMHPLYLMFPAALSCCMAFHMPVGTPPNAIVASLVHIRTKDMVSVSEMCCHSFLSHNFLLFCRPLVVSDHPFSPCSSSGCRSPPGVPLSTLTWARSRTGRIARSSQILPNCHKTKQHTSKTTGNPFISQLAINPFVVGKRKSRAIRVLKQKQPTLVL